MQRLLVLVLVLAWPLLAESAIVCRVKATGNVVETYSDAKPGICQQNLVRANPQYGYAKEDIEELVVTESERRALLATWERDPNNPDVAVQESLRQARQQKIDRLKTKLGLTDAEFRELQDVVN